MGVEPNDLTPLARSILQRAERPFPRYGTPEWDALPEHDLRRVAAILVAAECWREHCSTSRVASDLTHALYAEDQALLERIYNTSLDVASVLCGRPGRSDWRARVAAAERLCHDLAQQHMDRFTAREQLRAS